MFLSLEGMFGQIVIGPPGSGKTTYCTGMQQFLRLLDRKVAVINLDPANDQFKYVERERERERGIEDRRIDIDPSHR